MSKFVWSYSRLRAFEVCAKRYFHYDVLKDVEEAESSALREGNDMHKAFEARVREGTRLPLPYVQHEPLMAKLVASPGETFAEQKLGLTSDFKPAGFFGAGVWFRTVLDFAKVRAREAVVVDYKSGKVVEDDTQLALMAATLFHYEPNIEVVRCAFLFCNQEKLVSRTYEREQLDEIWGAILPRVKKLEQATRTEEYPPRPSGLCVRYCAVTSCPHHGTGSRW